MEVGCYGGCLEEELGVISGVTFFFFLPLFVGFSLLEKPTLRAASSGGQTLLSSPDVLGRSRGSSLAAAAVVVVVTVLVFAIAAPRLFFIRVDPASWLLILWPCVNR